jgi:uncharacterized protein (DUF433 family)
MLDTPTIDQIISRDAGIMGGTAVFRGTRVPVIALFDYLEAGNSVNVFLDHFPSVERDQVLALLEGLKAVALSETRMPRHE